MSTLASASHESLGDDLVETPQFHRRRQLLLEVLGVFVSVATFLASQFSMLVRHGWSLGSFRAYASFDQLANFAMVVNGAHGDSASVEPFTETGSMVDPHLYFNLLGRFAHLFDVSSAVVYNIAGVGLQVVLVVGLSIGFVLITRKWWTAYLGALPFLLGTLSSVFSGSWATSMQSHAVLWGAFGVMFAINSQSAALALGGLLLMLLLVLAFKRFSPQTTTLLAVAAGAGIGMLANVDTYGFFSVLFFALYWLSIYGLLVERKWWPVALSVFGAIVLFAFGDRFATEFGRVDVFALALVLALPGILLMVVRWRWRIVAPLLALVAAASPQLLTYIEAIHANSPFLVFRGSSSEGLGVTSRSGLIAAAPLLIPLLVILLAGINRKKILWIAYSAGSIVAWFLLAKNDLWGANQEPYQFWIDSFALTAFTIVPFFVDVARSYWPISQDKSENLLTKLCRVAVPAVLSISIVVAATSSFDWFEFYRASEGQSLSLTTPMDRALSEVSSHLTNHGLVMTDTCINPEYYKVVSGAPVDFYSAGLAWPARKISIDKANAAMASGKVTSTDLRNAGIGWLVTISHCSDQWPIKYSTLLVPVARTRFGSGPEDVVVLWRFRT